jgi:hypothetical protein
MHNAKIKMDIRFPVINTQKDLFYIGEKIIIPDIQGRINESKDVSNNVYPKLAQSTINQKTKKGLRQEPLIATGQLRRSPKVKGKGRDSVVVYLYGSRRDSPLSNSALGNILQNEGVRTKSGKRFFEFFGISDEAEGKAVKFMIRSIKEAIKRGERRIIR